MAVNEEEQGKRKGILKSISWKIEKQDWVIRSRIYSNEYRLEFKRKWKEDGKSRRQEESEAGIGKGR